MWCRAEEDRGRGHGEEATWPTPPHEGDDYFFLAAFLAGFFAAFFVAMSTPPPFDFKNGDDLCVV